MSEQEIREMERIEEELRRCLKHVPAPDGFADRVMARLEQRQGAGHGAGRAPQPRGAVAVMRRIERHAAVWTSLAAMLLLSAGGGVLYTRHECQEREAAQVQQQMDLAMELTSHALDQVQGGLSHSTAGQFLNELQ